MPPYIRGQQAPAPTPAMLEIAPWHGIEVSHQAVGEVPGTVRNRARRHS
jgi:hypothetical protein